MIDMFVPPGLSSDDEPRARLVVWLALAGLPICAALASYHASIGAPSWVVGTEVGFMLVALTAPLVLRATRSVSLAVVPLIATIFAAIALLSLLNGGFAIHVLMCGLLVPVAIPPEWPRFFVITATGSILVFLGLFALTVAGLAPEPRIVHNATGLLAASATTLAIMLGMLILVSRTGAGLTYAHVAQRDQYKRALLQSQKISSLGQLVDALVHDFNNVLMSMDYALYLLRSSIDGDSGQHEELTELGLAMERAKRLSHKLEDFGGDMTEIEVEPIDIDAALGEMGKVAHRIADGGIEVRFELDAKAAHAGIERSGLDQIVVNLLVNANDAIDGPGTITIRTERDGDDVLVRVIDTGSGIADDVKDNLFRPFFTTKGVGDGTGLGLWSAHQAATAAGGSLEVDSVLGRGTTMSLRLPITEKGESRPPSGPIPVQSPDDDAPALTATEGEQAFLDWFSATIAEPRLRLWGRALTTLSFLGAMLWFGFGLWYWLGLGSVGTGALMGVAGVLNALMPLVIRATRSVYLAILLLIAVELGGLAVSCLAHGAFQLSALVFVLSIPLVANFQKEYRGLGLIASFASLSFLALFAILAALGGLPTPVIEASATALLVNDLFALLSCVALFGVVRHVTNRVDVQLVSERDQFQEALVRSQKLEALGTFASSIAHDLNNVLMSLEFSTALLDKAIPPDHPGRVDIDELRAACQRIRSFARQLVLFGRSDEADEGESEVILDGALSAFEPMVRPLLGRHIDLRYQLDAGAARATIHPKRLEQLMLNLLLNARDAMPDGGPLVVRTRADDREVVAEIVDGGTGVDEEISDRIFDPFFTTETTGGRSGLGLWLCKCVTEEAGGELSMVSSSAEGTTMRVRLPRKANRFNNRAGTSPGLRREMVA